MAEPTGTRRVRRPRGRGNPDCTRQPADRESRQNVPSRIRREARRDREDGEWQPRAGLGRRRSVACARHARRCGRPAGRRKEPRRRQPPQQAIRGVPTHCEAASSGGAATSTQPFAPVIDAGSTSASIGCLGVVSLTKPARRRRWRRCPSARTSAARSPPDRRSPPALPAAAASSPPSSDRRRRYRGRTSRPARRPCCRRHRGGGAGALGDRRPGAGDERVHRPRRPKQTVQRPRIRVVAIGGAGILVADRAVVQDASRLRRRRRSA